MDDKTFATCKNYGDKAVYGMVLKIWNYSVEFYLAEGDVTKKLGVCFKLYDYGELYWFDMSTNQEVLFKYDEIKDLNTVSPFKENWEGRKLIKRVVC